MLFQVILACGLAVVVQVSVTLFPSITGWVGLMKVECGRTIDETNVLRCAIWYHLYNLKNVKYTHEGVLLLVKLQAKNLQFY